MKVVLFIIICVLAFIAQNNYDKQPAQQTQPKTVVAELTVYEKIQIYEKCRASALSFLCAYPFSR